MTGTEMLVLQQNIKHYILTSQTRALTAHELQEFEKIREQLLPGLLRFSRRSATPCACESSTSTNSVRLQGEWTASHPTASSGVKTTTQTPPFQPKSKSEAIAAPSERAVVPQHKPLRSSKFNSMLHADSQSNTDVRGSAANTAKKGGKKRPKLDIYQDPENVQTKRSRQSRQAYSDDSDKENRDPLDARRSVPKKKVLGDNTNITNNTTQRYNTKGKDVIRNTPSNKADTQATFSPMPKSKVDTQERPGPGPASTLAVTDAKRQPKRAKLDPALKSLTTIGARVPLAVDAVSTMGTAGSSWSRDPSSVVFALAGESIKQSVGKPVITKQSGASAKEQKDTTTRSLEARAAIMVRASVEGGDSNVNFAKTKAERNAQPVSRSRRADYEEVQNLEESEDLYSTSGSQEKTLPMPEFLLPDDPEDPPGELLAPEFQMDDLPQDPEEPTLPAPEFLLDDLPQDPPEEPTLPAPEFLLSLSTESLNEDEEEFEGAADTRNTADIRAEWSQDEGVVESTDFADGVWCIDDYKNGVVSTVCGYEKHWISVETISHVQFWQLDVRDDLSKSKWRRRIQLNKTSSCPIQIVYAPDDSFAVVLQPLEHSFVKVTLRTMQEMGQFTSRCSTYTWSGSNLSMTCGSLIVERESSRDAASTVTEGGYQLVFGAVEPGTICVISIPDNDETTTADIPSRRLSYLGTNERASSVTRVCNTTSLILASFGAALVLWDLNDTLFPVSVANVPVVVSSLPSPPPCTPSLVPSIVSATVPTQFFQEYKDMLRSGSLPLSEWPILVVLEMCDIEVNDHNRNQSERCALYVMKGSAIELIHKYQGSESISFASTSSRYVACQAKRGGKDILCLWDISRPEAVIQLSVLDSRTTQNIGLRQQGQLSAIDQSDRVLSTLQESMDRNKREVDNDHTFSSVSTLSPPPEDLSSLLAPSSEESLASSASPLGSSVREPCNDRHGRAQSTNRQTRQPMEWIDLVSVSWMERNKVRFSVQAKQHWVVVVQQDLNMKHPSVVHIMDFMSLLPLATA